MKAFLGKRIANLSNLCRLLFGTIVLIVSLEKLNHYSHNLTANANSFSQTHHVQASLSAFGRSVSPNFACSNVNAVRVKSWSDRSFWQGVNQLNPQLIRIPGGESSSYWNWRKGGLIDDTSKLPTGLVSFLDNSKDRRYNASKLEDLQPAFAKNGKMPLFVINMLTDDLSSQLEMLRTARDLGLPVKYIELGNEFYFPLENYRAVFPSIQAYTKKANRWITAIRQEFPQAKIAVVGVAKDNSRQGSRISRWNQKVVDESLPLADAITIHTYANNGLGDRPISNQEYPYFEPTDIPVILGKPFSNWQKISEIIDGFPTQKKIWVTEYNLVEDIHATQGAKRQRIAGSWLHGLYTISMSLLFLEDPRIDIACNHMLIGSSQFATILAHENSFIDPSDRQITNKALTLSATGHTQKFLGDVIQGMTQAEKINFANNYSLIGNDNYKYPALYGWMFSNQQQERKSLILNLSPQEMEINLGELFSAPVKYQTTYGSPRTLVTKTEALQYQTGTTSQNIMLPPYSITKISQ